MPPTLVTQDQVKKFAPLEAVQTVSQTNITLSGVQNLNGATGAAGKRVMVTQQTAPAEDGVYLMAAGAWERAEDAIADGNDDLGSCFFLVEEGTFAAQLWQVLETRGNGVVGTNQLSVQEHTGAAATTTDVFSEQAVFTPDTFTATVANTPLAGTLRVYRNGILQDEGGTDDYTFADPTITFIKKLKAGDKVTVHYSY